MRHAPSFPLLAESGFEVSCPEPPVPGFPAVPSGGYSVGTVYGFSDPLSLEYLLLFLSI